MIKQIYALLFFILFSVITLLAQEQVKTTAFSLELTPDVSFYSTYKNWTRNNQLGFGITLRHYRPIIENNFFAKRSFLLNLGIYHHEYFVPNTYLGLGYELENTIRTIKMIASENYRLLKNAKIGLSICSHIVKTRMISEIMIGIVF